MCISLFTVAIPVNFTSEVWEPFEDAAYVLPQLKRFAIVDDVEFFVSLYKLGTLCLATVHGKVISNTFPVRTNLSKRKTCVHLHYFIYPSN